MKSRHLSISEQTNVLTENWHSFLFDGQWSSSGIFSPSTYTCTSYTPGGSGLYGQREALSNLSSYSSLSLDQSLFSTRSRFTYSASDYTRLDYTSDYTRLDYTSDYTRSNLVGYIFHFQVPLSIFIGDIFQWHVTLPSVKRSSSYSSSSSSSSSPPIIMAIG